MLPAGFTDTLVAPVPNPIGMALTPDGRLLVTTQAGHVYGSLTTGRLVETPVLDLGGASLHRPRVGPRRNRRSIPQFAQNRFIYLYYTFKKSGSCEFESRDAAP